MTTLHKDQVRRPMKAETFTVNDRPKLHWPLLVSPKIDGIRCMIVNGMPVTQSMNPVPNLYIRGVLRAYEVLQDVDGELEVLDDNGMPVDYNTTQSGVMTSAGAPNFRYRIFDSFNAPQVRFDVRNDIASRICAKAALAGAPVEFVEHTLVDNFDELKATYERFCEEGYEGMIMRAPHGPYKAGRSTMRQGWMLKWKPWEDAEGIIFGFEEAMENTNENVGNAWGAAKRSHAKDGLVPKDTLGALILHTEQWGEVRVGGGNGMTHALRKEIWDNREKYLGKQVTFKYMSYGMKDKPRFPKFKGFRYD